MSIKADYLQGKLTQLCGPQGRLSPPRNLGERAQVEELAALSRTLDRLAPQHGYDAWWSRFEDALMASMKTRAWPTVHELTNAAARVPANRSAGGDGGEPAHLYEFVRDWWGKFRKAGPGSVPKRHHAQRLVDDGLASWGQLRRAGFDLPEHGERIGAAEADPDHPRLMAEIQAMGDRQRASGFAGRGSIRAPGAAA